MNLGVRSKLFLLSVGLIGLCMLSADLYLTTALDRLLTDRIRQDLLVRTHLVEHDASLLQAPPDDNAAWDAFADELGHRAHARVTLMRLDGTVLGDSDVEASNLGSLEDHRDRPEFIEALQHGQGASVRYSSTLRQRMLYVAVPLRHQGVVVGVARVAMPLMEVDDAIWQLRKVLLAGTLAALVLAVLLSWIAAQWSSQAIRRLTDAARRMAHGDLARTIVCHGQDEIAALGRALNHLASSLTSTLSQLKDERDLLEHILRGMREGILVLGGDKRILLVNTPLRDMLLLSGDAVGKPLLEVIRSAELTEFLQFALAQPPGQTPTIELDLQGLKPRKLLVRANVVPGKPGALLAVFVDVTDIRRLETLRKDFVANASHELRTPVTAVRSAAETLRSALNQPDIALKFLDIIDRNAERLQQLTEDLLELSRIESRELRLDLQALNVSAVAHHVVSLFQARADTKQMRLTVDVPDEFARVRADRRGLEQILTNLVDNAVKYCQVGASIGIRASVEGSLVRITVADNGPGITAKHLPRLFERFYRVDEGRSRELGGTGLGLSIVKHVTEAMGGTVGVDSTPGMGTSFSFTLPRAEP